MIRYAKLEDIPWMLLEAEDFVKMVTDREDYFNREHLRKLLCGLIENGIVLVYEQDGLKKGAIGGLITGNIYNPNYLDLQELFWWVPEQFRKSTVGYKLLLEFVKIGKNSNVQNVVISSMDVSPLNENALLKRGFKMKEKSFVMEN